MDLFFKLREKDGRNAGGSNDTADKIAPAGNMPEMDMTLAHSELDGFKNLQIGGK